MKLAWKELPSPLPGMKLWGAIKRGRSYVISVDTSCKPSEYLNRYAVSVRHAGSRNMLGVYDTLAEAKTIAENVRTIQ